MSTATATDNATKARALQLANEHGAAEAARQMGISASTIRSWRRRSGEAGPPNGADPVAWAAEKRSQAEAANTEAKRLLASMPELVRIGKSHAAKEAAVGFGILVDKAGVLEAQARSIEESNVRLTVAQTHTTMGVIRELWEQLELPHSVREPLQRVFAHLMRQHSDAQTRGDGDSRGPQAASDARAALRSYIRSEIELEIRERVRLELIAEITKAEEQRRQETPQLPPATENAEESEPGTWAGPVRRLKAIPPDEEVIDGEAIEEPVRSSLFVVEPEGPISNNYLWNHQRKTNP